MDGLNDISNFPQVDRNKANGMDICPLFSNVKTTFVGKKHYYYINVPFFSTHSDGYADT